MKADLHMHTTSSDGRLSNIDLIKRVKKNGVTHFSITDHDIIENVEQSKKLAEELGLNYIVGMELSTVYKGNSIHILGYFNDDSYMNDEITEYYKNMKNRRDDRSKLFIKNLKKHFDLDIKYEEVLKHAKGVIARPHMASAILEKYPEYSRNEIFDKFLGNDSKAYVPSTKISTSDGLELLKRNNAMTVLAHPALYKKRILEEIIDYGYDGIEAIYPLNKDHDFELFVDYASKYNMVLSAGSDYHGLSNDSKHGDVGDCYIEDSLLERFLNRLQGGEKYERS
ncbi:hypothetical protein CI105_03700 [Candidatus Izimaplasma bacterium ZiA1]|uniref:PHP domain-containing protein n=1 Tax=Candidatus Izimoplasma sp. ZiA1 TaxID=2024899 RepID=UPI000BAA6984|nr:hypothetical protein CI105_03700 [Candidatus Izimaplasma bacterium ZiA1]